MAVRTTTLLDAVTTTGAGRQFAPRKGRRAVQLTGGISGGAPGAATVLLEGSLDGQNWHTLSTLSLVLGVPITSDAATIDNTFRFVRGNVTVLTGTGANVTLTLGD